MKTYQADSSEYRYGMNTQEKDDEIFEGAYSAEYWEYDSRTGRRWNIDPRTRVDVSSYACFGNSPIWMSDHSGDTSIVTNMATGAEIDRFDDGNVFNTIIKVDQNFYNDFKTKFIEAHNLNTLGSISTQVSSKQNNLATFTKELKEEAVYVEYLKSPTLTALDALKVPTHTYTWEQSITLQFIYGSETNNKVIAIETSNSVSYDGNSLDWNTTFSDGSTMKKYSWTAVSGPHKGGMLPNGAYTLDFYAWNTLTPRTHKNNAYSKGATSFYIALTSNWKMIRGDFGIHADGNVPGTAGCIGLTGSEDIIKQFIKIMWSYRKGNITMDLNVNVEGNINNETDPNKNGGQE